MTYVAPVDQLRAALESGDVLELEEAVERARSVTRHHSPHLTTLCLRAQDMFAHNMRKCRLDLKRLRNACANLDEPAIFQALQRVHEAPESLQLMMYSDIKKAEDLREDILVTQEAVRDVLSCDDWRAVDRFLKHSAAVLSDTSVLALVQHREDLIRGGTTSRRPLPPSRDAVTLGNLSSSRGAEPAVRAGLSPSLRFAAPTPASEYRTRASSDRVPATAAREHAKPAPAHVAQLVAAEMTKRNLVEESEHRHRVQLFMTMLLSVAVGDSLSSPHTPHADLFPTEQDLSPFVDDTEAHEGEHTSALAASPSFGHDPVPRRSAPIPQSLNTSASATPKTSTAIRSPGGVSAQHYRVDVMPSSPSSSLVLGVGRSSSHGEPLPRETSDVIPSADRLGQRSGRTLPGDIIDLTGLQHAAQVRAALYDDAMRRERISFQ